MEQIVDVVKSHRLFADNVYHGSAEHLLPLLTIVGHGVAPPITASFHSNVGILTPLLLNNYHVRIAKLSGFGRGAAPRAQIR